MIVPLTYERWSEDGLKKDRKMLLQWGTNNYILLLCFDVINYLYFL